MHESASHAVDPNAGDPENLAAGEFQPLAPWWHSALLLAQLIALALLSPGNASLRAFEPHLPLYTAGFMSQGLQLSAAVAGLYHRRAFFFATLQRGKGTWISEAWRGVVLYLATIVVFGIAVGIMKLSHHVPAFNRSAVLAMAPANMFELLLWLPLCVVIGFCEEHVFRGYLLRQFLVWFRLAGASKVPATVIAIVITSVLFGSLHLYEGPGGAILIGILGAMYSVMALRRGNLRAVIVAHALQDSVSMIFVMFRHAHRAS